MRNLGGGGPRQQWFKIDDDRVIGASLKEVASTDAYGVLVPRAAAGSRDGKGV